MRSSVAGDPLRSSTELGILTLTLNSPDRRNAIDAELRDALAAAVDAAATDPQVRGVVVTGAGGAFCAGDVPRFDALHDARAAHAAGLRSEVVEGDLLAGAAARVERTLGPAALSFAAAERLLHVAADVDQRSAVVAESLAQTALLQTDDHREGLAAAPERREPSFKGT